jgi:hypothetical protein
MVPGGVEVLVGVTQDSTFDRSSSTAAEGLLVSCRRRPSSFIRSPTGTLPTCSTKWGHGTPARLPRPRARETALKELLLRVSALVENCPEVREMDLNPVKVLPRGVRVVDARIRVGRPPAMAPSRRIAY